MTHREKVEHLIRELRKRGVSPYTVAPPMFRIIWAMGINVPPPFFLGFTTLTLTMGLFFGTLWGLLMWLVQWHRQPNVELAILVSAGAGLCFGLSMAGYYRWKATRLSLSTWSDYPEG